MTNIVRRATRGVVTASATPVQRVCAHGALLDHPDEVESLIANLPAEQCAPSERAGVPSKMQFRGTHRADGFSAPEMGLRSPIRPGAHGCRGTGSAEVGETRVS